MKRKSNQKHNRLGSRALLGVGILLVGVVFFASNAFGVANFAVTLIANLSLQNGLLTHYTLDGTTGLDFTQTLEVRDEAGTVHGDLMNLNQASVAQGRLGQALTFDGVNQYIDAGTIASNVKTIAFWLYTSDTTDQTLIDLDGTDHIETNSTSDVTATSFPGTTTIYVDGVVATTLSANTWHHIVITDTTGVSASAVTIGRVASTYFQGTLDDIRFYDRVLSAGEVERLWGVGATTKIATTVSLAGPLDVGLVSHWTFDQAQIDDSQTAMVRDRVGSNHGTPNEMAFAWLSGWGERIPVTINAGQVSSTLEHFPVYVDLADMPAGFFSAVASDGADIRVTSSDGTTELPYELVSISTAGSSGQLHFRAPVITDDGDSHFYIYYDNPSASAYSATSTYGSQNVWTNGYVAVWHLEEDASGDGNSNVYLDSTGNGFHCDDFVTSTIKTTRLGLAQDFDGANDYIRCVGTGSDPKFDFAGDFSASAWFRPHSSTSNTRIFDNRGRGGPGPGGAEGFYLKVQNQLGGNWGFNDTDIEDTDGDMMAISSSNGLDYPYDAWYHVVSAWDSVNQIWNVYVNGGLDVSRTTLSNTVDGTIDVVASSIDFSIGGDIANVGVVSLPPAQEINGEIDEVRVMNRLVTSGWAWTEHNNQTNPGTFYTVGAVQTPTTASANVSRNVVSGKLGQALEFSNEDVVTATGDTPYLDIGNNSSLNVGLPATFAGWVKLGDGFSGGNNTVFGKGAGSTDAVAWRMSVDSTGQPVFMKTRSDNTTVDTVVSGTTIASNAWVHLAFSVDAGGAWTWYTNGSSVATGTLTNTTFASPTSGGYIGAYLATTGGGPSNPWYGQLDDLRVYNRALSASEVSRLYGIGATTKIGTTRSSAGWESGLLTHYTLDGTTGLDFTQTLEVRDEAGTVHGDLMNLNQASVAQGRLGQALTFDGVNQYIDAGTIASNVKTIAFWLYTSDTTDQTLIDLDGTDHIETNSTSDVTATSFPGTTTIYVDGVVATTLSANTWHHIVITDTTGVSASAVTIGRVASTYFQGTLDDIRFYDRVLSAGEVERLWGVGR